MLLKHRCPGYTLHRCAPEMASLQGWQSADYCKNRTNNHCQPRTDITSTGHVGQETPGDVKNTQLAVLQITFRPMNRGRGGLRNIHLPSSFHLFQTGMFDMRLANWGERRGCNWQLSSESLHALPRCNFRKYRLNRAKQLRHAVRSCYDSGW